MIQQRLPIAAITLHTPHYEQSCLSADKVPFEVPEGWVWCKLEEICHIAGRIGFRGYTKEDLVNKGNGAITLSPSNIIDGEMNYSKCTYISWEKYEESPEIQICNGDILLVKTGSSFGKCAFVRNLPQEATINPQFVAIKYIGCNKEYLTFVLQSQYARNNYDSFVLGTAIPTFTQAALGDMLIPLPPIHEQNNIVKEVKRREVLINIIDCNQEDLASSIEQTKSKILDLAIHGKLVPQDPMDEPAIELLRRINPKFTPCLAADSACDNGHYGKLPKNWTVCRLNELCSIKGGKRIPHGQTFSKEKTDHAYLRVSDMKNNSIKLSDLKYIDDDVYRQIKRYTIGSDDLYLTVAGTIGCVGIIPKEVDGMNLTENAVKLTNIICDKRFLMYSLLSSEVQNHFSTRFHQVAQPKLSIETASSTLINLPPYEEQKRIVEQIEKQFSSLNIIQSSLEA